MCFFIPLQRGPVQFAATPSPLHPVEGQAAARRPPSTRRPGLAAWESGPHVPAVVGDLHAQGRWPCARAARPPGACGPRPPGPQLPAARRSRVAATGVCNPRAAPGANPRLLWGTCAEIGDGCSPRRPPPGSPPGESRGRRAVAPRGAGRRVFSFSLRAPPAPAPPKVWAGPLFNAGPFKSPQLEASLALN